MPKKPNIKDFVLPLTGRMKIFFELEGHAPMEINITKEHPIYQKILCLLSSEPFDEVSTYPPAEEKRLKKLWVNKKPKGNTV